MSYDDSSTKGGDKKVLNIESLTGLQKAAIVLMSLDGENVTKVLSAMDQYEIKLVSQAILSLDRLPAELIEQVLIEANKHLEDNVTLMQNIETTKSILSQMLGADQIGDIERSLRDANSTTWSKLSQVDTEIFASYLKNEHPQTIALITSKLEPSASAKILANLPEKVSLDVIMRISKIDTVNHELLQNIEYTLREEFIVKGQSTTKTDYKKLVADIFNSFDRNSEEKFMKLVQEKDQIMADYIQEYMFTFDHLVKIDSTGIQKILRIVDKSKLTIALKGTSPEIRTLFFNNMSERASRILQDDMTALGPVRVREIDEAQGHVIKIAKDLITSGEITISEGAEDELVY